MKNTFVIVALMLVFFTNSAFTPASKDIKEQEGGIKLFASFLSEFEKTELPYSIDLGDLEVMKKQASNGSSTNAKFATNNFHLFIPELKLSKLSRSGPPEIEPIARYYPNEKSIAVIYKVKHRFWMDNQQIKLAIFDLKGKLIKQKRNGKMYGASIDLANSNPFQTTTASIDNKGNIFQTVYKPIWKKDYEQFGPEDNEITGYNIEEEKSLILRRSGNYVEVKVEQSNDGRA